VHRYLLSSFIAARFCMHFVSCDFFRFRVILPHSLVLLILLLLSRCCLCLCLFSHCMSSLWELSLSLSSLSSSERGREPRLPLSLQLLSFLCSCFFFHAFVVCTYYWNLKCFVSSSVCTQTNNRGLCTRCWGCKILDIGCPLGVAKMGTSTAVRCVTESAFAQGSSRSVEGKGLN
jgi:hypothetical protein